MKVAGLNPHATPHFRKAIVDQGVPRKHYSYSCVIHTEHRGVMLKNDA